jgi:DNA invertase Pin-like site-specific DNA recombinase
MKRSKRAHNNPPEPVEDQPGVLIGYARVSTPDQDPAMQVQALERAGCDPVHIHVETASGVKQQRPMLERALKDARRGDTFVVWKLDRMGRSLLDLINKLAELERRGIAFRSLTEGIDTSTPGGRLIMHVMASLAQFERDLIVERTRAGIRAKKERGERHGGEPTFDHDVARQGFRDGLDGVEVAKLCGVSRSRIYQLFPQEARDALRLEGEIARRKKLKSRG